jgi:hypothetical protein
VFLSINGAACLVAAIPAESQHSFAAEFDINKPVTLTGAVTKLEWTNPHAWVFIDAKDDKGNVQNWGVELVGINDLMRRGWARGRVNTGDVINVEGYGSRDGMHLANATSVKLASTGELLWASVPRESQKAAE